MIRWLNNQIQIVIQVDEDGKGYTPIAADEIIKKWHETSYIFKIIRDGLVTITDVYTIDDDGIVNILAANGLYKILDNYITFVAGGGGDVPEVPQATDDISGSIKTNSEKGIYLDDNGRLVVPEGGEGEAVFGTVDGTQAYFPKDIAVNPDTLGANSITISAVPEPINTNDNISMSIYWQKVELVNEAPAGSLTYKIGDSRAIGYMLFRESPGSDKGIMADSIVKSGDHFNITFSKSLNPNSAVKALYYTGYDNGSRGVNIGGAVKRNAFNHLNVGRNYLQQSNSITVGSNNNVSTLGSAVFGVGHDTHLATSADSLLLCGNYSMVKKGTRFAIGIGQYDQQEKAPIRKNAFEIRMEGEKPVMLFWDAEHGQYAKLSLEWLGGAEPYRIKIESAEAN